MPTYTAPTTRTTGELISAAIFNTDLVENIKYFKDAPAFAGNVTVGGTLGVTGAITSATSVALTGTTNNLGTITTGVWNAGAVTSSAAVTGTGNTVGLVARNTVGNGALVQFKNFASTTRYNFFAGTGYNLSDSFEVIASTAVGGDAISGTTLLAVSQGGLLTVSGFGTNSFSAGGTGFQQITIANSTAGTGNGARLSVQNDLNSMNIQAFSSTYTTAGTQVAGGSEITWAGPGGISISAINASGAIRFYSGGSTERMNIGTTGRVRMPEVYNVTGTGAALYIESDGNLFRIVSARRYKDNIHYDNVNGDAVYALKPVSYTLKALGNSVEQIGFIAEDVEEIEPRLVVYSKEGTVDALHYERVTVLLVKAMQNLKANYDATISQLAARIAALESQDN